MIDCRVLIFFSTGFIDARLVGSTAISVVAGALIFLHMKFSESSVKFSRLHPSFVRL
jgi:hypothetical protein